MKREEINASKLQLGQKFMFTPDIFSLTTPPPLNGTTIIKPSIDKHSLTAHRFTSSQLNNTVPLLIPADMGLPL